MILTNTIANNAGQTWLLRRNPSGRYQERKSTL
jgi:hypothetical protein